MRYWNSQAVLIMVLGSIHSLCWCWNLSANKKVWQGKVLTLSLFQACSSSCKCGRMIHHPAWKCICKVWIWSLGLIHPITIICWFHQGFCTNGTMCWSNMAPFVKFRPENYEKALMYMSVISVVNPGLIKFGDEERLDFYNSNVRKSVLTAQVPAILTINSSRFSRTLHYSWFLWDWPKSVSCAIWNNSEHIWREQFQFTDYYGDSRWLALTRWCPCLR